jgi:hypothetical protein
VRALVTTPSKRAVPEPNNTPPVAIQLSSHRGGSPAALEPQPFDAPADKHDLRVSA